MSRARHNFVASPAILYFVRPVPLCLSEHDERTVRTKMACPLFEEAFGLFWLLVVRHQEYSLRLRPYATTSFSCCLLITSLLSSPFSSLLQLLRLPLARNRTRFSLSCRQVRSRLRTERLRPSFPRILQ